ncbi:MAG TPA: thioredoxin domain-containing protein [Gemmatimonadales bacterium]|nr:thioredoxin domain-containing protein [Gemmatimonadales bacterium]
MTRPVPWRPWGAEAFAEATRSGRPVLLDIGAVWCHWCHVMDRESYEDPAIAEFLGDRFVCIRVDRDERPDVDARYQRAVQALTGMGGWPLTAFLTPEGEVFYGGTYFPPEPMPGRPAFRQVLVAVAKIWEEQRDRALTQAAAIRKVVTESLDEAAPADPSEALLTAAEDQLAGHFDPAHGGWGRAPKFPHPAAIRLLLARHADLGNERRLAMAVETLHAMRRGGIHDQLGGGFHRYSVDERWCVPHFEKMAYDNAELLRAYLDGHAATGDPRFAEVAFGIVRWVREVLAEEGGGYGASQDADVGLDDDGDHFTWTLAEAEALLTPDELAVAAARWDLGAAGEMSHAPDRNVLWVAAEGAALAAQVGRPEGVTAQLLATAEEKLRLARRGRPAPAVDRTRYTNWNAMLAGAMLQAGVRLGDAWARDHALATLARIRREAPAPDAVGHLPGAPPRLLDDQVQVAYAALDAYEATGDRAWLAWAEAVAGRAWEAHGGGAEAGLADVAGAEAEAGLLPARAVPVQDAPTPSPNGVAALVAARLAHLLDADAWRARHRALVGAFAGRAADLGLFGATFLHAMTWLLAPVTHLVIVGEDAEAERMHRRALTTFLPRRVVHRLRPTEPPPRLPAHLAAMVDASAPRAYVCRGETCLAPASTDTEWADRLSALRPS